MIINKPYTNKEYADLAVYCNNNNCHIEDKGSYLESVENPAPLPPTDEEQKENRARAYQAEVDPITSHISRLRDTNPMTEEVEEEISQLIIERDAKVEEIKERFPYMENEESDYEIDE
jgi:hypothetical protein